jgi:hypothetical protein
VVTFSVIAAVVISTGDGTKERLGTEMKKEVEGGVAV